MRYMISYDLIKPGRNYQALYDELEKFNAKRVLESQWVFRRVKITAAGRRDYFTKFIDSNDRILVVSIDSDDWAGRNLIYKISDI